MYFSFELNQFPRIKRIYTVTRNTVWQFSEKENLIILITEGKCTFESEGKKLTAEPGDIIFIPADMPYIREHIDNTLCTMTYIHFVCDSQPLLKSPAEITENVSEKIKQIDESILGGEIEIDYPRTIYIQFKNATDLNKTKTLYESINLFSAKRQFMCDMQASISLCSILALISQNTVDTLLNDIRFTDVTEIPSNLRKALGFISHNYSRSISLEELSKYCNVSKQQLIRYFKKAFNTTPTSYITGYKIIKAKEFLFRSPNLTIKEISEELGFDNQHYFTRVFVKATGETPSQYRYRTVHYKSSHDTSLPSLADL